MLARAAPRFLAKFNPAPLPALLSSSPARSLATLPTSPSNPPQSSQSTSPPQNPSATAAPAGFEKLAMNTGVDMSLSRSVPLRSLRNALYDNSSISRDEDSSDPVENIAVDNPIEDPDRYLAVEDVRLRQILHTKPQYGGEALSVRATDKIVVAGELMNLYNVGALLVMDENEEVVGIVSTRDFMRKLFESRLDPYNSPVSAFMTEQPVYAYADETALHCLKLMQQQRFRHLPVRDRMTEKTIGLVTVGDLVRTMMGEFMETNRFLKEYIDGKYL